MSIRLGLARVTLTAVLLACSSSCTQNPEIEKQRSFESAERYFAQGRFGEAIVEYRKALQADPKFGRARYKLAEAFAATSDLPRAYREYLRAADLLPDDLEVQIKAGNMLLLGRRFQDAKEKARLVVQKEPDNVAGLVLLGNALAGLRDIENAVAVTERATEIDPERAGVYANLGTLQLARGDRAEAERAFAQAVARKPGDVSGWLAQANFYRAIGDLERAEASFKRAVEISPSHPRANRVLATHYLDTNRPERAEPYLRIVAESQNDDGSWLDLADFYLSTKRFEEARGILKRVIDRKPSFDAEARMALVEHAAGNVEKAHSTLAEILKKDPKNPAAYALEARLLLRENRPDEALVSAKAALSADPQSAEGHFVLGMIQLSKRSVEDARKSFSQVLSINPTAADAKLELARLHTARGELDTAIGYAKETIATQPENLKARLVLARTLMVRPEDHASAKAVLDELLSKYPSSAAVHSAIGSFYVSTSQRSEARKQFERALQLDLTFHEALASVIALDLADRKTVDAWNRLRARLVATPLDPDLLLIGAKFSMTLRDMHAAEQFLRRLIAVSPARMDAYALLGQVFIAQGRLDAAVQEFQRITQRDPRSASAHTMLGLLMHRQQRVPEAIAHYQKAVEIDPAAAAAANNLAWLYAEKGDNLDVALQLATAAKNQLPGSAEVNDTVGWVYYKKEMWPLAITSFEQSVQTDPSNPRYHYHLGLAHAGNGDDAKARKALQQALTLKLNGGDATEAQRVLASLVY